MTQPEPVLLSKTKNAVLTLSLNRPERLNAANDELLFALTEALKTAELDNAMRVVVITGSGRGFCAGQDLGDVQNREGSTNFTEHLRHTYIPLIQTIRGLKKPVITAVNGVAAGAGASLALSGDIRLWSEHAILIEVFSNIALIPDAGSTWMLPRLVGAARAFEMMAFAEKIGAEDGLKLGLCEQVYSAGTFVDDVQVYAERLAARPLNALALTKQAINFALGSTLDAALDNEAVLQQLAGDHAEHKEGVRAFAGKRKPDFGQF
ncbi:enoyl-CoA hydratase-related protein [Deinococcus rubellus]|uniref:enoyl-CoA hydratase-related protein n=1 Tax=Deinococcus rubellus TaxID=1889240 RepID=UPI0031EFCB71